MKLNFSTIKEHVSTGNLHKLGRSPKQKHIYALFKQKITRDWSSVAHFILAKVFSLKTTREASDGKLVINSEALPQNSVKRLVPNDFPYNVENNIGHFLLWKLNGDITEQDLDEAIVELRKHHGLKRYTSWENPLHLKSIPEINHVHIVFERS